MFVLNVVFLFLRIILRQIILSLGVKAEEQLLQMDKFCVHIVTTQNQIIIVNNLV